MPKGATPDSLLALTDEQFRQAGLSRQKIGYLRDLAAKVKSGELPLGSLHNPGPAYMPVLLALALLVFAILVGAYGGASRGLGAVGWSEWRHAAAILGTCAFAAIALERLGYRLTMAIALGFLIGVIERQGVFVTLTLAVALAAGSYLLFDTLLRVPLPRGPFGL